MSNPNEQDTAVPIEGPKNMSSDPNESSTIPEPEEEKGKFRCTICSRIFESKEGYYTHVRKKHKVGSAISTSIY